MRGEEKKETSRERKKERRKEGRERERERERERDSGAWRCVYKVTRLPFSSSR